MNAYIDSINIIKLQKNLHELIGARISIYDSNFRLISFYPPPNQHTPICRLVRSCSEGLCRCNKSDLVALSTVKKTKRTLIYKCHAGLTEAIAPVLLKDEIICYLLIGQFLKSDEDIETQLLMIQEFCRDIVDFSSNQAQLESLAKLNANQLHAAFHLMDAIVSLQHLVKPRENKALDTIEAYVRENLKDDISLASIADTLHWPVSKTRKYINEYTGQTVLSYIQSMRIEKARALLQKTDLPVYEIALECGIPDYNYFSRVFKKAVGLSPIKYRNAYISSLL